MTGINKWSFSPYKPLLFDSGDIYISRVCPDCDSIHFEWLDTSDKEYEVFCRVRDEGEYKSFGKTDKCEFDICGLVEHREYEFYVQAGEKKSRIRLARCGKPVGVVVNYLHPEDGAYKFSGQFLCSPSLVQHPDGYLLASMDLFEGDAPQNLTLIYRSDDGGETWHYVSELMPCFWGKMFIHKGELYMLSVSTEYGDLLIGKSTDGGKTFGMPTVILRGSGRGKTAGTHKAPQDITYHNGRIYTPIEWGSWRIGGHAVMVLSCDENADLLVAENWHLSEPVRYNTEWEGIPEGFSQGNIEGNIILHPDGNLYNIMRYEMRYLVPDRGLIMAYKINTEDPEAPVEFSHTIKFMANASKFAIKKDEVSGKYYSIATRLTPERHQGARNLLSLMVSDDLENWEVACDLIDARDKDPQYTGFQYVDFLFDGDDIIYLCRTGIHRPNSYHNTNYSTFHRIKNFRDIK